MTDGGGDLSPRAPAPRTAWEHEHLDDPPDDAERLVELDVDRGEIVEGSADWRAVASHMSRERDYWHDRAVEWHARALDLMETIARLEGRHRREWRDH